jgi:hypothetical protein
VVDDIGDAGLVLLGSGSIPLARDADFRRFVEAAAGPRPSALTNNRYSGDVVAIASPRTALRDRSLAEVSTDNALPRWLADVAGVPVTDLRRSSRLGVDIDGPLDLIVLGGRSSLPLRGEPLDAVRMALEGVRTVASDPGAELLVAGRLSARTLAWLEANTASRTRAFVEERGMRTRRAGQRPAMSLLGRILDLDGPEALGARLAELADAAIIDTRVLLAHRSGADESGWPTPEDRFSSDLLLPERIADPWLRSVTTAALAAPIPIVLGGHTLVGPALRLALGRRRRTASIGA